MSGNKSLLRSLSISLLLFTATGCSAHSPFILWKTVDTSSFPNAPSKPPHDRPVFVSDSQVDSAVFDVLANIDVGYAFYGSLDWARDSLAERARELGADAVLETRIWHQPAGFGWYSPQASGKAASLKPSAVVDFSKISGEYR
jgi:hypothetical protein